MTANDFRRLALALPDTRESAHMNHPDFRVNGKIFATLGPGEKWGMVKLTPDQQAFFMRAAPAVFAPASGAWGRSGCTIVTLREAQPPMVRTALELAWEHHAPKPATPKSRPPKPVPAKSRSTTRRAPKARARKRA